MPEKESSIIEKVSDAVMGAETSDPPRTVQAFVSQNAKRVLIVLFMTIFGVVALFTGSLAMGIEVGENLNAVYVAAITGLITLGGTLVSNLWGNR